MIVSLHAIIMCERSQTILLPLPEHSQAENHKKDGAHELLDQKSVPV